MPALLLSALGLFKKLLTPTGIATTAAAILLLIVGVQTARLNHAKADQFDRAGCVAGQACKPIKWKDETGSLRGQLAASQRDLSTCQANAATLNAAVDAQSAATARMKADDTARDAATTEAVAAAHAKTLALSKEISGLEAERAKAGETPAQACGRILLDGVEDEH